MGGLALCALAGAGVAQPASQGSPFDVFAGTYALPSGDSLRVVARDSGLDLTLRGGDLLRFSDNRADSRVIAIEQRTRQLMDALIAGDRGRIADLLGASNGPMEDAVESTLDVLADALSVHTESRGYLIEATVYRDEDSDYGFEDHGWGWLSYVRFLGSQEDVIVRVVWDGATGHLMHRGTGGAPPTADRLRFIPRPPARSWVRAFDPATGTTKRVREVDDSRRPAMIPARFVTYDIVTHQTVGIRFRREQAGDPMRIEIGPLGSAIFTTGVRVER